MQRFCQTFVTCAKKDVFFFVANRRISTVRATKRRLPSKALAMGDFLRRFLVHTFA